MESKKGWVEKKFETAFQVDQRRIESPTHKVDCFKASANGGIGLEIEWNNKDPFFDRDLNNFRLLFDLRVISVGIIVTRAENLKDLFRELTERGLKTGTSFGEATTHWGKLIPRLEGGAGGGCPILALGIKRELYVEDVTDEQAREIIKQKASEKLQKQAEKDARRQKGLPVLDDNEDQEEDFAE